MHSVLKYAFTCKICAIPLIYTQTPLLPLPQITSPTALLPNNFHYPDHPLRLEMNRLIISSHSSLLKRFRQRRMGMTRPSYIFRTSTVLEREVGGGYHLPCVRAYQR